MRSWLVLLLGVCVAVAVLADLAPQPDTQFILEGSEADSDVASLLKSSGTISLRNDVSSEIKSDVVNGQRRGEFSDSRKAWSVMSDVQ